MRLGNAINVSGSSGIVCLLYLGIDSLVANRVDRTKTKHRPSGVSFRVASDHGTALATASANTGGGSPYLDTTRELITTYRVALPKSRILTRFLHHE